MKRLFLILFALALLMPTLKATDRITATITVTNGTVNGDTIVVNGSTRAATNVVNSPASQFMTNSAAGGAATNLWLHIASSPFSGPVQQRWGTTSNVFDLVGTVGQTMSVTFGGAWATVSYSTQNVSEGYTVRVPGSNESASVRTNIYSLLVTALNDYSTNPIVAGKAVASQLVGLTNSQTISGSKIVTGFWLFNGGDITYSNNALIDYGPSAVVRFESNAVMSFLEGSSLTFNTNGVLAFINSLVQGVKVGTGTTNWNFNYDPDQDTVMRRKDWTNSMSAFQGNTNSFAGLVVTNLTAWSGFISNATIIDSTGYNIAFGGNNSFEGLFAFPRTDIESLANGNNAGLDWGTGVYIKLKPGPTDAFSICGIAPHAFRDGRILIIENATGQAMTIADNSGAEPIEENRIRTLKGLDVTTAGDEIVMLIYDTGVNRWKLFRGGGSGGGSGSYIFNPSQFSVPDLVSVSFGPDASVTNLIVVGNTRAVARDVGFTNGTHNIDASLADVWSMRLGGNATVGLTNLQDGHRIEMWITNLASYTVTFTNVATWVENQSTVQPAIDLGAGMVNMFWFTPLGTSIEAGRLGLGAGTIGGAGTAGQVAYFSGSAAITSSDDFLFGAGALTVGNSSDHQILASGAAGAVGLTLVSTNEINFSLYSPDSSEVIQLLIDNSVPNVQFVMSHLTNQIATIVPPGILTLGDTDNKIVADPTPGSTALTVQSTNLTRLFVQSSDTTEQVAIYADPDDPANGGIYVTTSLGTGNFWLQGGELGLGGHTFASTGAGNSMAVGHFAGPGNNNTFNTSLGRYAGNALGAGSENLFVGDQSGLAIVTGDRNVGLGYGALSHATNHFNVAVGALSGGDIGGSFYDTNGTKHVLIGMAARPAADGESNEIVVGYNAVGMGSNTATIGDGNVTVLWLAGLAGWFIGNGSPEGAVAAPVGSTFSRLNGGAGTSFYVKESGTGNTGWAAK